MAETMVDQERLFREACTASGERGAPVRLNDATVCCRSCYVPENGAELYNLTQDGPLTWERGKAHHVLTVESQCTCEYDDDDDDDDEGSWGDPSFVCALCRGLSDEFEQSYSRAHGEYFYFISLNSAQVFAEELRARGFDVDWDGSQDRALYVLF